MRFRTPLTAMALGAALVLVTAAPAAAAPYASEEAIDFGDYTWEIQHDGNDYSFAVDETEYVTDVVEFYDAWDNGYFAIWDDLGDDSYWYEVLCADADLSGADANGDRVVSCGTETTGLELEVDAEIRLFGEGDLSRYMVTVANPTTAAVDFSWEFWVDYGETSLRATTTHPTLGENDYEDDDLWSYNWDFETLAALTAWGLEGASIVHERVGDGGWIDEVYIWSDGGDGTQLQLAPGESITLAFFQKVDVAGTVAARGDVEILAASSVDKDDSAAVPNPSRSDDSAVFESSDVVLAPANAASIAAAVEEFGTFDGRLVRGIPAGTVVGNWGVVPAEVPELAETGVSADAAAVLGVVGALTLAGGVLMFRARRPARR